MWESIKSAYHASGCTVYIAIALFHPPGPLVQRATNPPVGIGIEAGIKIFPVPLAPEFSKVNPFTAT